ncbi:MAG: cation diffusion facilitator family transporter [Acidimicrobiia bacterium]|nr:cation diffusion facilitator family transporter [Acidimicrobiia bacterium]
MHDGGKKAILAAFSANLGIAIMKFVAFIFTGAASLLAESLHSLADTGNQALLLLGSKRASKLPTSEHPFGFGSERYFWSFVVALVLFSMGGLFALYEGLSKLFSTSHELESPIWGFVVLSIAIVLEGFSLRTAMTESKRVKGNKSYWQFIKQAKLPELPVVLLEDVGALCGLVFALLGLSVATITGDSRFDSMGSIAVGLLLIVIAYILAVEMKSLLIGEAVDSIDMNNIRAAILDGSEAKSIIHIRTMHLGPEDILLGVKIESGANNLREVTNDINTIESRIRAILPSVKTIYIEPDILKNKDI